MTKNTHVRRRKRKKRFVSEEVSFTHTLIRSDRIDNKNDFHVMEEFDQDNWLDSTKNISIINI